MTKNFIETSNVKKKKKKKIRGETLPQPKSCNVLIM